MDRTAVKREDYDSYTKVTEQTGVVRWGDTWRAWVTGDDGDGAVTGPPFGSKAVAIAYCLRLVERGDYR